MGADATVYLNNGAKMELLKSGSSTLSLFLALKLLAYGANIKSLFYLDGVLEANNGAGGLGFIGFVYLDGDNIAYHADARKSKNEIADLNGRRALLLNDAGLNTRGKIANLAVLNNMVGSVSFSADFISSYYDDSSATTLEYKLNGGSWNALSMGALAMRTTANRVRTLAPLAFINAGDVMTVRGTITNPEGMPPLPELTTTITAKPLLARYSASWPSLATGAQTIYIKSNFNFTAIYTDASYLTSVADGYYVFEGYWYQVASGVIINENYDAPGTYPAGDPGNPTVATWDWYGYSAISRDNAINNGQPTVQGTHYKKNADGKWYTTYSGGVFSNLVPTGFYADELSSGITKGYENGTLKPPLWNG